MKKAVHIVLAVVMGIALVVSTGLAAGTKYSGFLGDYYKKLHLGPEGGARERWVKPDVDFSKYNKLMVDSVIFYFADDSEDKGIDAEEMKELSDAFNQEIVNALKDKYPIVAEPGPDVARLRIAITGVKKSKPGLSVVSSIVPIGIGVSLFKKGVSGSYSGSGGTNAEFMALDSVSNAVIAVAVDERTAGYTERFTSLGSAKEAFKFWAERIRIFIDTSRAPTAQ
jgi:hypothetical protein